MSNNFISDITNMNNHYKVNDIVHQFSKEKLLQFLQFRTSLLTEEYNEFLNAPTADDVVDALIDIVVIALGTLDTFDIDINKAWDTVLNANMQKEVGVNPRRQNLLNLPDLVKPTGWKSPSHLTNLGLLRGLYAN